MIQQQRIFMSPYIFAQSVPRRPGSTKDRQAQSIIIKAYNPKAFKQGGKQGM
jgi:hypothetical protein